MAVLLPVLPFIAVGIATLFVLAISNSHIAYQISHIRYQISHKPQYPNTPIPDVLNRLDVDPHILNSAIYYGILYGPFAAVYAKAKAG